MREGSKNFCLSTKIKKSKKQTIAEFYKNLDIFEQKKRTNYGEKNDIVETRSTYRKIYYVGSEEKQ